MAVKYYCPIFLVTTVTLQSACCLLLLWHYFFAVFAAKTNISPTAAPPASNFHDKRGRDWMIQVVARINPPWTDVQHAEWMKYVGVLEIHSASSTRTHLIAVFLISFTALFFLLLLNIHDERGRDWIPVVSRIIPIWSDYQHVEWMQNVCVLEIHSLINNNTCLLNLLHCAVLLAATPHPSGAKIVIHYVIESWFFRVPFSPQCLQDG